MLITVPTTDKLKNVGLTDYPSVPQHTGLHTSAWPLIPEVYNTANRADLK